MTTIAYLDVGPLFERTWTGIPAVNAEIASRALVDEAIEWRYMFDNLEVDKDVVAGLVRDRSGADFALHLEQQALRGHYLNPAVARKSVGIFLNVKTLRSYFGREALVVHDLSTVLTPEFHHQNTINHHANRMRQDVETTDFFFCVSRATSEDLIAYFKVPPDRTSVLPLGIRFDPCHISELAQSRFRACEPYVVVLSTIEPRKNGAIIFELIDEMPAFFERFKIVFVGRDGWLESKERLLRNIDAAGLDRDRIVFTGFVDERRKASLIYNSAFCIYPSFFEGFGLPILEAAALGKFVVCSNSSSMTEVAPEQSFFFDPLDATSLARAVRGAENAVAASTVGRSSFPELWDRLSAKSFAPGFEQMRRWILQ